MQTVQVSTSIKDRQTYMTLQKLSKGLSGALGFTERASGTHDFGSDSGSGNSPHVNAYAIYTGYYAEPTDKYTLVMGNLYNVEATARSGLIGANANSTLVAEDNEVVILIELVTNGAWSFTDLTADWVLLEVKP